jgi:hypothetical protein
MTFSRAATSPVAFGFGTDIRRFLERCGQNPKEPEETRTKLCRGPIPGV